MAQDHLSGLGLVQVYHDNTDILFSGVQRYFDNALFSDVTVVTPSGRKLLCHRLVLASCSRRFATILEQGAFVTGQELPVDGVESGALELILRFFYTGECPITVPSVLSTYDVAVKLEVQGLSGACEVFIKAALSPNTCAAFLDQALKMKIDSVAELCLNFARNRLEDVMLSDSFQHCSTETMLTLLTENRSQHGETTIAKGAARWLAADPKRISLAGEVCTSLNIQMSSLHLLLQAEGENNNNNNGNGNNGNNGGDGGGSGGGNRPGGGGGGSGNAAFGRALSEAGGPLSSANNGSNLANMLMSANQNLQGMSGSGGAQLNGGLNGLPQNLLNAFPAGMSIQSMLAGGNGAGQGGDLVAQLAQMTGGGGLGDNNGLLSLLSPRGMADNPQLWNGGGNGMRRSSLGTAPLQQQLQQQLLQQQLQQQMGGGNGNSGGKPPRRASAAKSNYGDDDSDWETSQGSPVRESQPRGGRGGRGSRGGGGGGGGKRGWDNDQGDGFGGRGGGMRNNNNGNNRGGMKDDGSGDGMLDDSGRQMQNNRNSGGHLLPKGVCHVDGCSADLSQLRDYHQRFKICDYHLKLSSIMRDGVPQRFCQQCGRFHPVDQFDGYKRSCRDRLQRHNAKRRKKAEEMQQQHMGRSSSGSQQQGGGQHRGGPSAQQQQQQQQLQQHLQQQGLLGSDGLGDLQRMLNANSNNNNGNNNGGNGGGGGYQPMLGSGGNGNSDMIQRLQQFANPGQGQGALALSNEQQQMLMDAIGRSAGGGGIGGGGQDPNSIASNMHLTSSLVEALTQQQMMMQGGNNINNSNNNNQGRRSSGGAGGNYQGGGPNMQQVLNMGGMGGGMNTGNNGHMSGGGNGGGGDGSRNSDDNTDADDDDMSGNEGNDDGDGDDGQGGGRGDGGGNGGDAGVDAGVERQKGREGGDGGNGQGGESDIAFAPVAPIVAPAAAEAGGKESAAAAVV